jgi:hypothetical protein
MILPAAVLMLAAGIAGLGLVFLVTAFSYLSMPALARVAGWLGSVALYATAIILIIRS